MASPVFCCLFAYSFVDINIRIPIKSCFAKQLLLLTCITMLTMDQGISQNWVTYPVSLVEHCLTKASYHCYSCLLPPMVSCMNRNIKNSKCQAPWSFSDQLLLNSQYTSFKIDGNMREKNKCSDRYVYSHGLCGKLRIWVDRRSFADQNHICVKIIVTITVPARMNSVNMTFMHFEWGTSNCHQVFVSGDMPQAICGRMPQHSCQSHSSKAVILGRIYNDIYFNNYNLLIFYQVQDKNFALIKRNWFRPTNLNNQPSAETLSQVFADHKEYTLLLDVSPGNQIIVVVHICQNVSLKRKFNLNIFDGPSRKVNVLYSSGLDSTVPNVTVRATTHQALCAFTMYHGMLTNCHKIVLTSVEPANTKHLLVTDTQPVQINTMMDCPLNKRANAFLCSFIVRSEVYDSPSINMAFKEYNSSLPETTECLFGAVVVKVSRVDINVTETRLLCNPESIKQFHRYFKSAIAVVAIYSYELFEDIKGHISLTISVASNSCFPIDIEGACFYRQLHTSAQFSAFYHLQISGVSNVSLKIMNSSPYNCFIIQYIGQEEWNTGIAASNKVCILEIGEEYHYYSENERRKYTLSVIFSRLQGCFTSLNQRNINDRVVISDGFFNNIISKEPLQEVNDTWTHTAFTSAKYKLLFYLGCVKYLSLIVSKSCDFERNSYEDSEHILEDPTSYFRWKDIHCKISTIPAFTGLYLASLGGRLSRPSPYDRELWTLTFTWNKQCAISCSVDEIVLVHELFPMKLLRIYHLFDISNTQFIAHFIFSRSANVHIMIDRNLTQSSACSKCEMRIAKDVQWASFFNLIPDGYHVIAKKKVSWNQAFKICRNLGLWLPKITDKENQLKINSFLDTNEMQPIYFLNYRSMDQVGFNNSTFY